MANTATQVSCRVFKTKGASVSANYSGHSGVDVTADGGFDYVVAHSAGEVVWVQTGYGNLKGSEGDPSYGNAVQLRHANGWCTLYAHMREVNVSYGQQVGRGAVLGYMGDSGNAYGAHLHFEVRNTANQAIGFSARDYLHADLPGLAGGGAAATDAQTGAGGVEISKVTVKTRAGETGRRPESLLGRAEGTGAQHEVLVQHKNRVLAPVLTGSVTLEWQRKSAPGTLDFTCAVTEGLALSEGDAVSLRVNGKTVFFGYIFEKSRSGPYEIAVKAYDQLRYLKNKGTLAYAGKTYTEVLEMIAKDCGLTCGTLEDTGYKLPQRVEDGTYFDMLLNASDETVLNDGKLFVLYDDCGKLCLQNIERMAVPLLLDADTAGGFSYKTSIDSDVYTRITLASDNDETGERELYVHDSGALQSKWGVLQYYESMSGAGAAKLRETAKLLAGYYGRLRRTLSLSGCLGDIRVRGGSSVVVRFRFDDLSLQNYMVVEKVKHTFQNGLHTMDLDVSGVRGEFTV